MARTKAQGRVRRNHRRYRGRHDLNVVPMIDMMVILVFFLIFSAVFTRTSILELNLPLADATLPEAPQDLQLEIIVRKDRIEVADHSAGLLKVLENGAQGPNFVALSEFLQLVKAKYPDHTEASILLEPEIEYDTLVQTMDSVRLFQTPGKNYRYGELFPDVSVRDAPL